MRHGIMAWGREPAHLRGNVVRGATEGACGVALKHALSAHPKVCYLDVAFAVKQHIIQLQIPDTVRGRERDHKAMNHFDR